MAAETKKYVDSVALKHLLEKLRDKNASLYLEKTAEAASAAKVKNALTLTVGDTDVAFDGSEAKSAAVAAKEHKHAVSDINDFATEVQKVIASAGGTTHTHGNLETLEKINDDSLTTWNNKIGTGDVEKIVYTNDGVGGTTNVKKALDILVANVQITTGTLTQTTKNIDAVKKIADDAAKAVAAEKTRAEGKEGELKTAIDAINNETTGILKQAKDYADGKDTAIAEAKKAGTDAQTAVDVLAGKVGTVEEGKTVVELITDAKKAGTDAAAAVATEKGRAEGVEQGLRADLGTKEAAADAEGSAFARIAKVKADLGAKAAQDDVDALEAKVGEVPADKTVVQMIEEAQTNATYDDTALKNRVATIEGDYLKAADKTELQGKIDTAKATADDAKTKIDAFLDANAVKDDTINTLKEIQLYIQEHGTEASGMVQDIAANAQAIKDEADRAKAAEKVNADAIAVLNGADTVEGSVAKAVKEAKEALQANIDKKVDKSAYDTKIAELVKADTDNLAAAKKFAQDEDKKITDVIGTAEDTSVANTVFGKIKALQEKDAAQDEVIGAKAAAADLDALEALVGEATDTKDKATAFGKIAAEAARADAAEKALGGRIDTADSKIAALETKVGDAESGLVKDVADLKTTVGDASAGLVKEVADLKAKDTALDGEIEALKAKDTALVNEDTRLAGLINTNAADIATNTGDIANLQAWTAAHGELTTEDIDTMLSQVYGTQA